jgi:1,4-dihydroxy-6-naphthoate synthase
MERLVDWGGLDFSIELLDIQELNDGLREGRFDVAKVSFHAALSLTEQTLVLPSGSALGFGVGPLLLAARPEERPERATQITLCPGPDTTATLLFRLFYPDTTSIQHVVFSSIMPLLGSQQADFGVCIHEGRFTWSTAGLTLIEDLGTRWESETGFPLPLGGILARRNLGDDTIGRIQETVRGSLEWALQHPEGPLPTMRRFAQEFDDEVLMKHVALYVNEWTKDLGDVGANALNELSLRAQRMKLIPAGTLPLMVYRHGS